MPLPPPLRLGLVGTGRIGTAHARTIAERVPGAVLAAVADVRAGAAGPLADTYGAVAFDDPQALIDSPDVDAVVITASSTAHSDLIVAVAGAGKPAFCEKPASMTLAEMDRALAAVDAAGTTLQVGFNRRFDAGFAAAHAAVVAGEVGQVQLMRSLTRDPGLANPAAVPPWTVFTQTLIHDFDTLLWLNPGASPVEVYATADALVAPDFADAGLLDTAVVVITFDNGARAVAEASFSAAYGYDVRAEVFGSAGMVTVGDGALTTARVSTSAGRRADTARGDVELMGDAYAGELRELVAAVREDRQPSVTGHDARRALAVALACVESVKAHAPVTVTQAQARAVAA
ncbi:Gfo/Idh/MocA family oxidoreductase [Microlunatus flavus]|uniref:Myo-inositol 2-dehydrogenase / D-chiro-inositol 1-dehydrogenase n=1 Tax=Microlunatus flavus TaxID=1036181 RepID=A0A1H9HZ34_9ACTN|nr:Gfo/Idh/MocA family oxidoreductase [Microlunatus flavus]SEQ67527.1 myo-inositol 2-dehydrogenase / D-chiro-inositol 1-dehydrogenase [Microlunatus flavus]